MKKTIKIDDYRFTRRELLLLVCTCFLSPLAQGEVKLNGTVISGSLAVRPDTFLNASQQLREPCTARSGNDLNSFMVKGRGGVPLSPGDLAPSNFLDNLPTKETAPRQGKLRSSFTK